MITFKNELPMDHEKSIEHIVSSWSIDMYEHDKEMGIVKPNLDYCTEIILELYRGRLRI